MEFLKFVASVLLAMLFLLDADLVWQLLVHGRRPVLTLNQVSPDAISIHSRRVPITVREWGELAGLVAVHAILIVFLLRARRKSKSAAVGDPDAVA
jgi:hypothetical protein